MCTAVYCVDGDGRRRPVFGKCGVWECIGIAYHILYRSIQTQVNNITYTTAKHYKKKPKGCAEGRGFASPLRFLF